MFFTQHHIRFIKRFLFLLIPFSLLRIGFYFYHLEIYKQFQPNQIFDALILGIRFDVAAICLLNIPILLLSLIPSTNSNFLFFERLLFVVVNTIGILAALNDFELFLFMGKRLSADLFTITDDIWAQLPQLVLYYWYFPLLAFIFGVVFYFFDRKFFRVRREIFRVLPVALTSLILFGFYFVGIRGGFQLKSINIQSAFIQGHNELGHLVLNTPYHFIRTLKNKPISRLKYFTSDDAAKDIILNARDLRDGVQGLEKANVVLLILESVSLEYMEKGYTPFLTELSKESLFFTKHLANGRRSIEALPSILCGLPSLLDEPISKGAFQGNRFSCFPKVLKDAGYSSAFFHGGSRGTMGFESYTLANGFEKYYAKEDYPHKKDFDGHWGIYDGPYLNYVGEKLDELKEPFLGGVFTISSHQPYSVPEKLKGKFPKGTLEIHESIGYLDQALRDFFGQIKDKKWFKNTIFIITSDHTQKLETKKFQNTVGQYRVPLLIYVPGHQWEKISTEKVTQHSDIPKTVLDFIEVNGDLPATSVSVFNGDSGLALNYASGSYYAVVGEKILSLDKDQKQSVQTYDWANGEVTSPQTSEDPLLKAYLQYFMNGLINNNLSF